MSTRVNISYLFSIMLLLLTGCEQETSLTPSSNREEPVEILLSANVMQVSTSITRSDFLDETSFENSKEIGLFGLRTEGASFKDSYINNLSFTTDNGSLTGEGKIYFPAGNTSGNKTTAYLYGYYPYTAEPVSEGNETLIRVKGGLSGTADSKWAGAGTDPLHATASPTIVRADVNSDEVTAPQQVTLNFSHRMAQLQIRVNTSNTDYLLQEIITTFNVHQHGYMNVRNGAISSANQNEEECTETFSDVSFTNSITPQSVHSAIPGNNAILKIQIKVKVNGAQDGVIYEAFNAVEEGRSINLTAGNITKVIINFNPSSTTKTTLNDWGNTSDEQIDYN